MEEDTHSYFEALPPELKVTILHHLKIDDIRSARLVCKQWQDILDTVVGNTVFIASFTNQTAPAVLNSKATFDHLIVERTTEFPGMNLTTSRLVLPTVRHLSIDRGNTEAVIFALLKTTNSAELQIRSGAFENLTIFGVTRFLRVTNWESLRDLTLDFQAPKLRHTKIMATFLKLAKLPNLKIVTMFALELDMRSELRCDTFQKMYRQFLGFLARHGSTITSLSINMLSPGGIEWDPSVYECLEPVRLALNLTRFNVGSAGSDLWPMLCVPCGSNSNRLTIFRYFLREVLATLDVQEAVEKIVENNSSTLRVVDIGMSPLNFECFRNCDQITSMTLVGGGEITWKNGRRQFPTKSLAKMRFLELSQFSFNEKMAKFIGEQCSALERFHVGDWGFSEQNIPTRLIPYLLNCPKLLEISFGWGLHLDQPFGVPLPHGFTWSCNHGIEHSIRLDRSLIDIGEIQNLEIWNIR